MDWSNKEEILEAISWKDNKVLENLPEELKNDKEFILESIKKTRGVALGYASEELKSDKEFILKALQIEKTFILYHINDELYNDREIALEAIKSKSYGLFYISEKLLNDKNFISQAVKFNGNVLEYASEDIKKDKELVLEAIKNGDDILNDIIENMSEEILNDEEIIKTLAENEKIKIDKIFDLFDKEIFNKVLSENKELALKAIKECPDWYIDLQGDIIKDIDVITTLFENVEKIYDEERVEEKFDKAREKMSEKEHKSVFADRELVKNIVKMNGAYFEIASRDIRKDKEILLIALKADEDCIALNYASYELRNDKEVLEEAIEINPWNFLNASDDLKNDKELALKAVEYVGSDMFDAIIDDDCEELVEDEDFIFKAVKLDNEVLISIEDEELKERIMKKIEEEKELESLVEEDRKLDEKIQKAEKLETEYKAQKPNNKKITE